MKKSLLILLVCLPSFFYGQSTTFSNPGNSTFVGPAGITSVTVQAWGAGGAGGGSTTNSDGARAGAGGGGGAFASAALTITSGANLPVVVGVGGTGVTANNGNTGGFSTITGYTGLIYAAGGLGGAGNVSGGSPLGGSGGTVAGSQGTTRIPGGNGGNGETGAFDSGAPISSGVGGTGANGGGAGGTSINTFLTTNNGNAGTAPGGGGSGARTSFLFGYNTAGGAGGAGKVVISYTCPTYSLTGTVASAVNVCSGTSSLVTLTGNLPVGLYKVTYEVQGVVQPTAAMEVYASDIGTGTFIATGFTTVGTRFIKITGLSSGSSATASENCNSTINSNNLATVIVNSSGTAPVALAGTGATCNQITANWQAVAGATYYELDVSTVNTFATFVTNYNARNVSNVLTFNVTGLSNATYYYRVRAYNGTCISANSNTITYATTVVPGTVTSSAATSVICTVFTANWSAATNATSYLLDVSTSSSFAVGSFVGGYEAFDVGNNTTYTVTGLTANTQYYYRVKAKNGCGVSANFSGTQNPKTSNAIPGNVNSNSGNNLLCNSFNARWANASSAVSYLLDVSTSPTFAVGSFVGGYVAFDVGNVTSYIVTGLTGNTQYYYRLKAKNGCGVSTLYSATESPKTTTGAPAPTGVTSSVLCTEIIMSWAATTGVLDYTTQISTSNTFPNTAATQTFTGITATTYTFVGLTPGTPYFYRVLARNGCSAVLGTPSTTSSGTTTSAPGAPTISTLDAIPFCQTDGATLTSTVAPTGYTYLWSTGETTRNIYVSAAGSYTVQFVKSGGCSSAMSLAKVITVQGLPTAIAGGSQTICSNTSATVSGATATNGDIKWTFSGSGTLSNDTTLTPTYTPTPGGAARTIILTMTVTSVNSCAPQIATATYTINVQGAPTVSVSGSQSTCSNGSITVGAGEATATNGTILWTHNGAGTISGATTLTPTYTAAATDAGKQITLTITVTSSPICATSYVVTDTYPVIVRANNTVGTASSSQTLCINTLMTDITHATTGATGIGTPVNLPNGVLPTWAADVLTISGTPTESGTFNYSIPLTGGCGTANATGTITVKSVLASPILGKINQPTCVNPIGSIELSGLLSGYTIIQNGDAIQTYSAVGADFTVLNLAPGTYTFSAQNGANCPSLPTASIEIIAPATNIWKGSTLGWSKGSAPTNSSTESIEFADDYQSAGDLAGCSCKVDTGKTVVINSGHTLAIDNAVVVESGGTLTFKNDASLLQTNTDPGINTGKIKYERIAEKIVRSDFVYWSSPVEHQKLIDVSPLTLGDKFMGYNGAASKWDLIVSSTEMKLGKGYIIRAPQNYDSTTPQDYPAIFEGTPNNGTIEGETVIADKYYLIGNPYPSALKADDFLDDNPFILGTLYFWTHNTTYNIFSNYKYSANDYATYNGTGSTSTLPAANSGANSEKPSGFIAAGQSFFARTQLVGSSYFATAVDSKIITFNNDMRIGGSNNDQFFKHKKTSKETAVEKNRIWLNLTNTEGAFKQTLVGYVEGATNDYDTRFDGISFDSNTYIDFYSINNNRKFTIQGRTLPFTNADVVPLGYRTTIAGNFTISIDQVDGLFNQQAIYLEDKTTGTINDLRVANYTFTTTTGTFPDRFVLRYTDKTLGTGDFENLENNVLVSIKDKVIKVTSGKEIIKEVAIFDTSGKLIYDKNKVGETELLIPNLQSANQVLLVKISLENDSTTTKKIIF